MQRSKCLAAKIVYKTAIEPNYLILDDVDKIKYVDEMNIACVRQTCKNFTKVPL